MSKLAEKLRAIKVYNNWEILRQFGNRTSVVIEYHRPAEGGWTDVRLTSVWSPCNLPQLDTDNRRTALSRGSSKEFIGNRAATYWLARNWAMETFGDEYVPSPFGGLIPKHVKARAERAVKAAEIADRAQTNNDHPAPRGVHRLT